MSFRLRNKEGKVISKKGIIILILAILLSWFALKFPEYYYGRTETQEYIYKSEKIW